MKALLTWFTIFVFAASGLAQTDAAPAKPKKRAHKAAVAPAPPAVTADDLKALRDAMAEQQAQIQALQSKMAERDAALQQTQQQLQQAQSQQQDTQSKAATAVTPASQTSDSVSKLQSDVADIRTNTTNAAVSAQEDQKKVSALATAMGRFRFSGDVRVRGENFTQNGIQDRNRARIRVRLGLEGALNQDFIGGVAIATGSQGDPTTTNETLTNFFDRKTIALDKGYITYNPVAHNWFSVTGGKFAYLWQRTSVTGDPDLNPEGFDAKLSFNVKNGFFTNFTLQDITLLYSESSGGQDSYVLGGQAQTSFKAGPWSATASFLNEHWNRPDALLAAGAFAVGRDHNRRHNYHSWHSAGDYTGVISGARRRPGMREPECGHTEVRALRICSQRNEQRHFSGRSFETAFLLWIRRSGLHSQQHHQNASSAFPYQLAARV